MTPDGHLRLVQAYRLVHEGTISLPAHVGDLAHGNIAPAPDGTRYSVYNPGQILLFVPFVWVADALADLAPTDPYATAEFLVSFLSQLAHVLAAWLLFKVLLELGRSERAAATVALLFAVGTVGWSHAADSFEHPQETAALMAALLFAVRSYRRGNESERWGVEAGLSGFALGVGLLFRNSILCAVPGLLWLLRTRRRAMAFAIGLAPAVLVVAGYNLSRFGSPFETGYPIAWAHSAPPEVVAAGFFSTPLLEGLNGLWASPGKGMLFYSPILLLTIPGWIRMRRSHPRLLGAVLAVVAGYTLLYSTNWAWHGSVWTWGPRYLVPLVPLLMLGFPTALGRWRLPAYGLIAASIAVQLVGLAVDVRRPLVEIDVEEPSSIDEESVLFSWRESLLVRQAQAAASVVLNLGREDLRRYVHEGPWHTVNRPVSNREVLERGVDFNALNLWWYRARFFRLGAGATVLWWLVTATAATGLLAGGLLLLPWRRA